MNLLLLEPSELSRDNTAEISGRRFDHIVDILRLKVGDRIKAGLINGKSGVGTIVEISDDCLVIGLSLQDRSEPLLPVTLLLALPRPKMLKRILQTCAGLGVRELYLINSYRVEKSYWQSPSLESAFIHQQLLLGLEQAGTTALPQVHLRKRFKPFIEDELDIVAGDTTRLLAHPGSQVSAPLALNKPATLVIGPEGGLIAYEVQKLTDHHFAPVTLGNRILKVETAVTAFLSRLYT